MFAFPRVNSETGEENGKRGKKEGNYFFLQKFNIRSFSVNRLQLSCALFFRLFLGYSLRLLLRMTRTLTPYCTHGDADMYCEDIVYVYKSKKPIVLQRQSMNMLLDTVYSRLASIYTLAYVSVQRTFCASRRISNFSDGDFVIMKRKRQKRT